MNKERRKAISKAMDLIDEAMAVLGWAAEEEQEAFDNMPESLQESDRGMALQENADGLAECAEDLGTVYDSLADICAG